MGSGPTLAALVVLHTLVLSASAATIVTDVRDPQGSALPDAVVYAIREGNTAAGGTRAAAVMDQKDKTFIPHVLPVQVGTSVKFPNSDDIQHQVYSFSQAKTFQLPLYKGTPANPIVFTSPGVVVLGCNIHDKMNGYVVVVDTPYFSKSEGSGRVEIEVPAGQYVIHVWHPNMREEPPAQTVSIPEDGRADISFAVTPAPAMSSAAPMKRVEDKFKKYGRP